MTAISQPVRRPERVQFRDVATSEWTKLRSLRSTGWSFAGYVLLSVGMSVLATSLYSGNWDHLSADNRRSVMQDPIGLILQPGGLWGQVAICVLGAILFATEYSTGTVCATMLAVPRRTPVLAAKAAVFAAATFVVSEVVAFTSFFLGRAIISKRVPVSMGDPGVLRAIVGSGLALAVVGLFALSIGVIVRHVAGAITLVIALITVVPTIVSALPGKLGDYLAAYLPGGGAVDTIMSSGRGSGSVVSPWQGFAIGCAWTTIALMLAAASLRRRDV
jgi:hypothetical protein